MHSAGRKIIQADSPYQNKVEEVFPIVSVYTTNAPELRAKNMNEMFEADSQFRVVGIEEMDKGNGDKEIVYRLEMRQFGIKHKDVEEMTPDEVLKKIEEKQD